MKFCLVFAVLLLAVAAAPSQERSEELTEDLSDERNKRTLGVDKNYEKQVEVKTPKGGFVRITKKKIYNDGGAVVHLPTLLDSFADKEKKILSEMGHMKQQKLDALHHHHHHQYKPIYETVQPTYYMPQTYPLVSSVPITTSYPTVSRIYPISSYQSSYSPIVPVSGYYYNQPGGTVY